MADKKVEKQQKKETKSEVSQKISLPASAQNETGAEEMIALGGNIELRGFSEVDGANMLILKKIIGSYARKMSETIDGFEKLAVVMKPIHQREKSEKYEVHARIHAAGRTMAAETVDRNLFFAVDASLKKVISTQKH